MHLIRRLLCTGILIGPMIRLTSHRIIDWDKAQIVPSPAAVQHPLFIADIPGWRNDGVIEGMTFEEDREYLEGAMRDIAARSDSPIAQQVVTLLATSFERQFFELSLRNKVINEEYVRQRLKNRKFDDNVVLRQLEDFLLSYEAMRGSPTVLDLLARFGSTSTQCH